MATGQEATVTTTLKNLTGDKFELMHLKGKRLILFNDIPNWAGDLSVLKAITGGDAIPVRWKFSNESEQLRCRGRVIITSNHMIHTRDTSGALLRRIRLVKMDHVPSKPKPLIFQNKRK